MDFVEIPILEAAACCGLRVQNSENLVEVKISCPFCNDKKKRFYFNTLKDQFFCQNCGTGGNSITLYAEMMGVDNKTAYRDLTEKTTRILPTRVKTIQLHSSKVKPIEERHKVYTALLNMSGLNLLHRENLLNRGLSVDVIKQKQYKTVPRGSFSFQIAEELSKQYDLKGIPGFFTKNNRWYMAQKDGLFIPMRQSDGRIQGMQIRMDDASDGKYKWFSSAHKENGEVASGEWTHFAGWNRQTEAVLTEGGLKADVASYYTDNICFIGTPGVNCADGLITKLKSLSIQKVYLAYDMDRFTNIHVKKAVSKVVDILSAEGIQYQLYEWELEYKGIDDLLYHQYKQQAAA